MWVEVGWTIGVPFNDYRLYWGYKRHNGSVQGPFDLGATAPGVVFSLKLERSGGDVWDVYVKGVKKATVDLGPGGYTYNYMEALGESSYTCASLGLDFARRSHFHGDSVVGGPGLLYKDPADGVWKPWNAPDPVVQQACYIAFIPSDPNKRNEFRDVYGHCAP